MTLLYWPETLPQNFFAGMDFSPKDEKAVFEPGMGEPISRPRSTGAPFIAQVDFLLQNSQITTFEEFYHDALGQGSQRFALRDPITGEVRIWRFMGLYQRTFLTKAIARVSASLMRLPGAPWYAPYVPSGFSTVPRFVADYENDIFGVDGTRGAASSVTLVEGTYDVARTVSGVTTTTEETLTAGDIPATAPADTTLIVGYAT